MNVGSMEKIDLNYLLIYLARNQNFQFYSLLYAPLTEEALERTYTTVH